MARGEEVHGELESADASTAVEVPLYDADGNEKALGGGQRLVVTDVIIQSTAGGEARLFFDNDGDETPAPGNGIALGDLAANGVLQHSFDTPRFGRQDAKLFIEADADVFVVVTGYILLT